MLAIGIIINITIIIISSDDLSTMLFILKIRPLLSLPKQPRGS